MAILVGRHRERAALEEALRSPDPELVAVYGRRRVGKTFLVRASYGDAICFELVGTHDGTLAIQLRTFAAALADAASASHPVPADWHEAFDQLRKFLVGRLARTRRKQVVFFDELPWLASRKSGFLPAFEQFWNGWAGREDRLVIVICGSAASWMLEHIVRQRGGLHNRVTRRIRLEPFTLAEVEEMLASRHVELGRYQTIELYMALGGVPQYLAHVRAGESAAQAIDRLCFARDGFLRREFFDLYGALFDKAERHEAVVRALASRRRGMTRGELLAASALGSGGAATKVLDELEECGFIMRVAQLGRLKKDALYWLADEYSLFYLTWIERHHGRAEGTWLRKRGTPAWRAWTGLAFEAICLKHAAAIKHALGISGIDSVEGAWARRGDAIDDGAQIDLVIDRSDRCVNLCEMKFSEAEFVVDKAYARELLHKKAAFEAAAKTRKTLFPTLVTTYGVRANEHAQRLGIRAITMDALFDRPSYTAPR